MAVVQSGAEGARNLVVGAKVPDIRQAAVPAAGSPCVAEGLWLKCTPTQIPKIGRTRQTQCVQLTAKSKLRGWTQVERAVPVLVIHHVVERKTCILAWRGQHLEESAVMPVMGVPVAAPVRIARADPGLQDLDSGLPSSLADERSGTLR